MKYIYDYLNAEGSALKSIIQPSNKFLRCMHKGKHTTVEVTIILCQLKKYMVYDDAYFVPLFDYWESVSDEFIGEVLIPIKKKNEAFIHTSKVIIIKCNTCL